MTLEGRLPVFISYFYRFSNPVAIMSQQSVILKNHRQGRVLLAVEAVGKNQFSSIKTAAATYDVPYSTLKLRLRGRTARGDTPTNRQKLNKTQELLLVKWVLDMDQRGLPPTQRKLQGMANILLSNTGYHSGLVGPNSVTRFVERHPDLSSSYTRKYDYQRAQCESLDVMKE